MKTSWMMGFTMFMLLLTWTSRPVFASTPQPNDEEYLPFAEEMPAPVHGLEGIIKTVVYPEVAKRTGVEGKVFVLAYINENGGVDDVKIVKGIGAGCDEAAMSAVKKAKFTPGKSKGKTAKVKLSLSIAFKIK